MAKKKASAKKTAKSKPKESSTPGLASLRRQIDALDKQIVHQINARAELAKQIGSHKASEEKPVYQPQREEEILQRIASLNQGPLDEACVRGVFRELISGCRALEQQVRVAFLGPQYTYSHLAAIHRFGQSVELAPVANIASVFEEVDRGQADFGLVPIENSTDGRVTDTLDMFAKKPVKICGEVPLRIHHNLLGLCARSDVKEVYSKPQALSQCRNWITRHLPQAQVFELASTAEAARLAQTKEGAAAVASYQAATNYQLKVLAKNIEDDPENLTRFAVISQEPAERTGDDKTSIMYEVEHKPGALADSMMIFKRNRLNLTWIESFPIPQQPGRYLFFVELLGHQRDLRVRRAIASLEKKALRLEVLGSYARMDPID